MNSLSVFLLMIVTALSASCAPAVSLDADTLRQNALDAQTLNSEFQTLNASDPCDSGLMACIGGALAHCSFGTWQVQPCSNSQHCFAVPSVTSKGANLSCTSEADVLSILKAAGVPGGLSANSTNTTVAFPTQSAPVSTTPSPTTSVVQPSAIASTGGGVDVVTVTVTLPLTLPTITSTLLPQDALSILASLSSEGFSISTISSSFSSAASSAPRLSSVTVSGTADCTMMSPVPSVPTPSPPGESGIPVISPYRRHALQYRRKALAV